MPYTDNRGNLDIHCKDSAAICESHSTAEMRQRQPVFGKNAAKDIEVFMRD
jgi:hypothetical protein